MCLYAINARDGFLSFFVHYSPWISSPTNLVYVFKEYDNVGCAEEQLSEKISERKIFRSSYGTLRKDRVAAGEFFGEFFGEIEGKPHNFYTMEYVVPITTARLEEQG
ncbi:BDH_1b_G0022850.mRNA.1.CDS.1 [Saccharomyces cerevisiae]|nr:BDH_1b_G0022850.mRNA.1.CDS.1 [Saccharomyces cerevisiae]CAI4521604.1 ACH_G0022650.mRNA.1.CDS.1 [Saccharomyces cerevisiae]CAI6694839.1 ACH_G0022650.mRNA.1.CDS.1 [Saccharomyces cerevisiae]CAI7143440.1 BDH_1b_G0022850.mRNA.1.CDS.1 [Saccharomyces cerevisiae]